MLHPFFSPNGNFEASGGSGGFGGNWWILQNSQLSWIQWRLNWKYLATCYVSCKIRWLPGVIFDDFPKFSWKSKRFCWIFSNVPLAVSAKQPGISRCSGETRPCEFRRGMFEWSPDQDVTAFCNDLPTIGFIVGRVVFLMFATRICCPKLKKR